MSLSNQVFFGSESKARMPVLGCPSVHEAARLWVSPTRPGPAFAPPAGVCRAGTAFFYCHSKTREYALGNAPGVSVCHYACVL